LAPKQKLHFLRRILKYNFNVGPKLGIVPSFFLTINQHESGSKQSLFANCWFLDLSFNPEDGSDMFLRNVGCLSVD
jgi:hypothetical protein